MFKNQFIIAFMIGALALSACNAPQPNQGFTQPQAADEAPVLSVNQPQTQNIPATTVETVSNGSYPIVDTNQTGCYDNDSVISCPNGDQAFAGQDGNYQRLAPAYQNNNDGTITDLNTGLTWTQSPDINGDGQINVQDKLTYENALAYGESLVFAGYDDWRLPSIKELYSLIDFSGTTGIGSPTSNSVPSNAIPYIDTNYFDFGYGDTSAGERYIDAQFATSTKYVSTTMQNAETMFGVNFADGRIKGYGFTSPNGGQKSFYFLFVRGNNSYGQNSFVDNGNGTITDNATGLTWLGADSGSFNAGSHGDGSLNWQEALSWCESLDYAGQTDWRLPDAKELHSIVDYTRSPDTTNSAAIDPLFTVTYLPNGVNNTGTGNYPHTWTSTTHLDGIPAEARAVYIAFGEARGIMNDTLLDVHGAGAQRSDVKSGDPSQLPIAHGPQGDVQSIYNYARCVSGGGTAYSVESAQSITPTTSTQPTQPQSEQGGLQPGQPPQEAINACSGLAQEAACSFNTPNGLVSGSCGIPPNASQLVCMPAGGPPQ